MVHRGPRHRFGRWRAGVALSLFAVAALPALAADSDAKPGEGSTGELATVEVTARYVTEDLQTTPLAITAVSGADLESRAIIDTTNLGAVVPNLYTRPGDAEEGPTPTISMRGCGPGGT